MAKIKNVVKVMNFHSLLRVDSAKKKASKYFMLEHELTIMIDSIVNNTNFILDKRILIPDKNAKTMTLYFGSDYGFCSNYNSQVGEMITKDKNTDKIILGKKMSRYAQDAICFHSREAFEENPQLILQIINDAIEARSLSEIYVVYNRFNSINDIKIEKKKIYPVELDEVENTNYYEDFEFEGDINKILRNMIKLFLEYQVAMCTTNTSAAENILRQNTTSESLKKIDEREVMQVKEYRKQKKTKEFRKVIETFSKQRSRGN